MFTTTPREREPTDVGLARARGDLGDGVAREERGAGQVDANDRVPLLLGELLDLARLPVALDEQPVANDARRC